MFGAYLKLNQVLETAQNVPRSNWLCCKGELKAEMFGQVPVS